MTRPEPMRQKIRRQNWSSFKQLHEIIAEEPASSVLNKEA